MKCVTFLPKECIFMYYDAFNIYPCYFISIGVKPTPHFSPRIRFRHLIPYNIGKISVASEVNFIFNIKNLVSSVTAVFQHQVFCLSEYSTIFFFVEKGAYHFFSMRYNVGAHYHDNLFHCR